MEATRRILIVSILASFLCISSSSAGIIQGEHVRPAHTVHEYSFSEDVTYEEEGIPPENPWSNVERVLKMSGLPEEDQDLESEAARRLVDILTRLQSPNLHEDEELLEAFGEALERKMAKIQLEEEVGAYDNSTEEEEDPWVFSETCKRDMDRFVKPITGPLIRLVDNLMCEWTDMWGRFTCSGLGSIIALQYPRMNLTGWGFDMIDAAGKPGMSLTQGNIHWVGDYDWCQKISGSYEEKRRGEVTVYNVRAQYCRTKFTVGALTLPLDLGIFWGLCVPDTCTDRDLIHYLNNEELVLSTIMDIAGLEVGSAFCGHDLDIGEDPGAIIAATIVIIIILLVVSATLYDIFVRPHIYTKRMPRDTIAIHKDTDDAIYDTSDLQVNVRLDDKEQNGGHISTISGGPQVHRQASHHSMAKPPINMEPEPEPITCLQRIEVFFIGFSAYSNLKRIFRHKRPAGWMSSIDGFRVITAIWVLFGYSMFLGTVYAESVTSINAIPKTIQWIKTGWYQLAFNMHMAGDTFLLISGVLVAYLWHKQYDDNDKQITPWMMIRFYLHRYWRLMPTLMIVVMVYANMYQYLSAGPLVPTIIQDAENCGNTWWINFLMIQNLYRQDEMCISWSWTTAVAFQVHVFAPLVLVPLVLNQLAGYVVLVVMFVICVSTSIVTVTTALPTGWAIPHVLRFYYDIIMKPWYRSLGYIIGMALGDFLYKYKKQLTMPKWLAVLGWIIALTFWCLVVFVTHEQFNNGFWNEEETVGHLVFGRIAFCLAIAWMILACETGHGGGIYSFLKWGAWRGLAPVMYTMMVLTPILIYVNVYGKRQTMYLEPVNVIYHWCGNTFTIFAIALIVSIGIEHPTRNMSRAIFSTTKDEVIMAGNHKKQPYKPH